MGSARALEGWAAPVKRGKVMFEIAGVSEEVAREALLTLLATNCQLNVPVNVKRRIRRRHET